MFRSNESLIIVTIYQFRVGPSKVRRDQPAEDFGGGRLQLNRSQWENHRWYTSKQIMIVYDMFMNGIYGWIVIIDYHWLNLIGLIELRTFESVIWTPFSLRLPVSRTASTADAMGKVETEASARDDLAAVYRMCHKLGLNEGAITARMEWGWGNKGYLWISFDYR